MMACTDNSKILKEGVLHRYEKTQSKFLKQENWKTKNYYAELQQHTTNYKSLECNFYSCKDNRKGSELKDKIEMIGAHQVSKSATVGVEKHKYDNYICITPASGSTVFLSFKAKSERDDWYDTIVSALTALKVPVTGDLHEDQTSHRPRVNTEPQQDLVKRRVSPSGLPSERVVVSEPVGGAHGFGKVLNQLKEDQNAKNITNEEPQSNKVVNPCCIRNHVVAFHKDATNMVYHPEKHYENVHFVHSENDWHKEITAKRSNVKLHKDVYNDFHQLTVIQSPQPSDEPPQWPTKQRPRQPSITHSAEQDVPCTESAEPTYMNTPRGRRSPVESDERDINCPNHGYINDRIDSGVKHHNIGRDSGVESSASFQHPNPPPPTLPQRNDAPSRIRATSMKDRPLPQIPPKEDEEVAKVKTTFGKRPSKNNYVPSPIKPKDQLPIRQPPLPPVKGNKLQIYQRSLQDELRQENGITKQFLKRDVVGGKIALVEYNDSLIIAGWEPHNPTLTQTLHIGDKLTMVNQQMLSSASFAQETIKLTAQDEVTLKLQRIPYGQLVTIHKDQPGHSLGIEVKGNEIKLIHPNGLITTQANLRPQTPSITNTGLLCNYAITEINMRPVGFNATTKQVEEMLRNAGENVSLILHPIDLIQVLKGEMATTGRRYSFS